MKIGFVLDDTLDSTDGVQQYILTLGAWLRREGHEVHYLVGQTSRTDIPHIHSLSRNVGVRFNGNRMSMPLPTSAHRIRELLAAEQFDVLHVQVPYSPFLAGRIIRLAPPSTAVIGTFHIAPHRSAVRYATRLLAAASRRSLARFNGMLSVSSAARDFGLDTYGIESRILPNVVDVGRFAHARPIVMGGEGPVIVFLGRLVPRKGCRMLLEAIKDIVMTDPERKLRVVICGRGPLETELKEYAHASGIDHCVQFAGYISEADKPGYLRAADVAVFPSSGGESFGIVLLEAMAAGHPVVLGADNEGYRTVLAPHSDQLFAVNDARALSLKIRSYLDDVEAVASARAWQSGYIEEFDVAAVGRQLIEVYRTSSISLRHK